MGEGTTRGLAHGRQRQQQGSQPRTARRPPAGSGSYPRTHHRRVRRRKAVEEGFPSARHRRRPLDACCSVAFSKPGGLPGLRRAARASPRAARRGRHDQGRHPRADGGDQPAHDRRRRRPRARSATSASSSSWRTSSSVTSRGSRRAGARTPTATVWTFKIRQGRQVQQRHAR